MFKSVDGANMPSATAVTKESESTPEEIAEEPAVAEAVTAAAEELAKEAIEPAAEAPEAPAPAVEAAAPEAPAVEVAPAVSAESVEAAIAKALGELALPADHSNDIADMQCQITNLVAAVKGLATIVGKSVNKGETVQKQRPQSNVVSVGESGTNDSNKDPWAEVDSGSSVDPEDSF
jgi:hypothetical protein